jgi:hypothetical protein
LGNQPLNNPLYSCLVSSLNPSLNGWVNVLFNEGLIDRDGDGGNTVGHLKSLNDNLTIGSDE